MLKCLKVMVLLLNTLLLGACGLRPASPTFNVSITGYYYVKIEMPRDEQLSLSGAAVQIYAGNNRIKTFYVPKNQMGTVWHVFDITEDGVVAVNNFYNSTSAGGVK